MKKNDMFKKIEKLYFNKSYNEVTTQEIWDLFWINKASLYHYFSSKEILFQELLNYSFENFMKNLEEILDKDLDFFIKKFLNYPFESKSLFATIKQNNYCEKNKFIIDIKNKQKETFDLLYLKFKKKYWFNKEKTFILFSLLDSLSRKKCINWGCYIEIDSLLWEIKTLFINK